MVIRVNRKGCVTDMMIKLISIGIGGFFGAIARYLVNRGVERYFKGVFPLATLIINLVGCFLLGFILTYALKKGGMNPVLQAAITTGFLGAFTTFSTFTYETLTLLEGQNGLLAMGNVLVSVAFGLFMGWLGIVSARGL